LVIGDLIIDDYVTCDAVGMSQEDPTIVVTPILTRTFVGGAGGVAAHARGLGADPEAQAAAGLAACVGHSWPVFARFRGGKAVATAFGGLLMVSREAAAWATVGGIGALTVSRTMSVGSLTAAGTATLGAGLESSRRRDAVPFVFTALASALVIVRHAPNIRRIARGEEPKLSARLWGGRH